MVRTLGRWTLVSILLAVSVLASGVARAESRPLVVWYRNTEGCPDATAFLSRLQGPAAGAKLASVGDYVDFVVTLGSDGTQSSGRLERQSERGTVAVRELSAKSCEEVADVLALTLTLTVDPTRRPIPRDTTESTPARVSATPSPELGLPAVIPVPVASPATASAGGDTRPRVAARAGASPRSPLSIGVQGGFVQRLLPAVGPLAGAFVEFAPKRSALPGASLRLSALAARAEDTALDLSVTVIAGRLELCPIDVASAPLHLSPCLGFELGSVRGEGASLTDDGVWAAAVGQARFGYDLSDSVALHAQIGATTPLIRYSFHNERSRDEMYRLEPLGVASAAGISFRLP